MEKNKYAAAASKAEERYELTTKLFCGYCGYPMVGESCKAHGNTYRYYSCGERKRGHGCKKKPVNKDWIERYVAEETARTILTDSMIEQIAVMMVEQLSQESSLLPSLEHQLKDTQKKIDNFVHAIEQGIFNEHTQQRMAELDLLKSDLECQIIQEKLARPMFSKENIIAFLKHFQDGNVDDSDFRRELFDTFVNAIFLFDDKIVLTYNGRKGAVTLKLAEVKEAAGLGESFPDRCSDSSTFSPPKTAP